MASANYLSLEGGESLIEFIVRNCAITEPEIQKFEKVRTSNDENQIIK